MTSVLQRLLDSKVIHTNDPIVFKFKRHTFGATIAEGGLIGQCTMNGKPVDLSGFKTLTDWCDSCIQELVQEYVTRFSSWKRVKHVPTGKSFTQLRDVLIHKKPMLTHACRCAEVTAARRQIVSLEQQVMLLKHQLQNGNLQQNALRQELHDDNPFKLKF